MFLLKLIAFSNSRITKLYIYINTSQINLVKLHSIYFPSNLLGCQKMAPSPQEMVKKMKDKKKKDEKQRQAELFKKARELALLCGGEAAILVVSHRNEEVFASGHPSVDSVVDRFTHCGNDQEVCNSNNAVHKVDPNWWNKDVDKMGLEELEEFVEALEELKKMVQNNVDHQENKPQMLGG